ncbi:MAG: DoxX family protein [Candidatus Aminicenantales bacterium]
MNVAFLMGRLIVGAYYIYNGLHHFIKLGQLTEYAKFKGVPLPQVAVIGAGILLLIGGITIVLGKFPEIGVAALVLFFIPVTFMMHNFWAVGEEMKAGEQINFLKNMALLGSALMFLAIKRPWPLSVGHSKK